MKTSAFFVLLPTILAIAACDSTTPTSGFGTPPIKLGGDWSYSFDVSDGTMASCQVRASFVVNQSQLGTGDQFTGVVQGVQNCMFAGETFEDNLWGPVSLGEIGGESVRFTGMGCLHMGTASGDPPNLMLGVATCSFSVPPETPAHTFSGSWQAIRSTR